MIFDGARPLCHACHAATKQQWATSRKERKRRVALTSSLSSTLNPLSSAFAHSVDRGLVTRARRRVDAAAVNSIPMSLGFCHGRANPRPVANPLGCKSSRTPSRKRICSRPSTSLQAHPCIPLVHMYIYPSRKPTLSSAGSCSASDLAPAGRRPPATLSCTRRTRAR
jgi:hypothetical protein